MRITDLQEAEKRIHELEKLIQQLELEKQTSLKNKEANQRLKWWVTSKTGSAILGFNLKNSLSEILNGKINSDNLAKLIIAVFWRFTRIGLFAIIVALIPFILLFQQNKLIEKQGNSLDEQNKEFQKLITNQNKLIEMQNNLSLDQNRLFDVQNTKTDTSTVSIMLQMNLMKEQTKLLKKISERMDK